MAGFCGPHQNSGNPPDSSHSANPDLRFSGRGGAGGGNCGGDESGAHPSNGLEGSFPCVGIRSAPRQLAPAESAYSQTPISVFPGEASNASPAKQRASRCFKKERPGPARRANRAAQNWTVHYTRHVVAVGGFGFDLFSPAIWATEAGLILWAAHLWALHRRLCRRL